MHDCPDCGMACDCDGDDTWTDAYPIGPTICRCGCPESEDGDDEWPEDDAYETAMDTRPDSNESDPTMEGWEA